MGHHINMLSPRPHRVPLATLAEKPGIIVAGPNGEMLVVRARTSAGLKMFAWWARYDGRAAGMMARRLWLR